jgi:hypothetical protein
MYPFAIMALLSLGVVAVALLAERMIPLLRGTGLWALILGLLGVGAAWLVDFNLFALWGVPVRATWIGVTITGVALAGFAHIWYGTLSMFRELGRKYRDEAATIEKEEGLRRVA